jgi:glycosyltransferase involved in cell wall biosynthesis
LYRPPRTPRYHDFSIFYTSESSSFLGGSGLTSPPLRICIASGTFHPDAGGPPTYLLTLGRELLARQHAVRVVTYGDERVGHRYPYPVTRVPRRRPIFSRLALFTREVLRAGRRADLLFVNDYGLPAALANLVLRRPMVMKIVGDFAWEYSMRHGLVPADEPIERFQAARYGLKVEALRRIQATYARRADLIVTPSGYLRRIVIGWGVPANRLRIVENAVADPTGGIGMDAVQARRQLGLPPRGDVVLAVARLTTWKGIDTLIAALPALRERRPGATLVVVGDGPDRARLESIAERAGEGAVSFAGEVPRASVALHLRAASVLALCSGYEGLSHVLLEAMAAGVPVVASAVGGNLELIRDGENGLLVPFGDVEATRAALARLLEDEPLATRLAACARDGAAERTVDRMVEQTVAVFREAIEGRRRA